MLDEYRFVLVQAIRTAGLGSRLAGKNSHHNGHLISNVNNQTVSVVTLTEQEEYRWC